MGLALGGLQSGGAPISSSPTFSGIITALGFVSTQASGSDAFAVTTNGARWHVGTGTNDYFTSDGTTVFLGSRFRPGNNLASGSTALNVPTGTYVTLNNGEGAYIRAPLDNNVVLIGDIANTVAGYQLNGVTLFSTASPTIQSGFGTSPSVVSANGTAAFRINVGTGGVASTGVIGLPAAPNGWLVFCNNLTTPGASYSVQTAFSPSSATIGNFARTTGTAGPWAASEVIGIIAMPF